MEDCRLLLTLLLQIIVIQASTKAAFNFIAVKRELASHEQSYRAGEATGRAEGMTGTVKEKARESKDKTAEKAHETRDKSSDTAEQAKEKAHEGKEKTKGVFQQTGEKMKHAAQTTADTVKGAFGMAHHHDDDEGSEGRAGHEHTTTYRETKY